MTSKADSSKFEPSRSIFLFVLGDINGSLLRGGGGGKEYLELGFASWSTDKLDRLGGLPLLLPRRTGRSMGEFDREEGFRTHDATYSECNVFFTCTVLLDDRGDRMSVIEPYLSTSRKAGGTGGIEPLGGSRLLLILRLDDALLEALCEEL